MCADLNPAHCSAHHRVCQQPTGAAAHRHSHPGLPCRAQALPAARPRATGSPASGSGAVAQRLTVHHTSQSTVSGQPGASGTYGAALCGTPNPLGATIDNHTVRLCYSPASLRPARARTACYAEGVVPSIVHTWCKLCSKETHAHFCSVTVHLPQE